MLRFSFCPHLLCHGIRQHHYSTMSMPHIDRNLFLLFFVILGNRQMQRQFPNHHYDPRLWIVHSINQILNDTEWSGSMSCSCDRDHIKSYCPINCYFHLCSFVLHCTFTTNLTLHKTMHHPKNLIRRMTSLNAINRITQKKMEWKSYELHGAIFYTISSTSNSIYIYFDCFGMFSNVIVAFRNLKYF